MTAPADVHTPSHELLAALAPGTWGVYDEHRREWAVPPSLHTEREAWAALLAVDCLWPWMLDVRQEQPAPPKVTGETLVDCPDCDGEGSCDTCAQDCPRCDGGGQLARAELTASELAEVDRRDERRARRRGLS